MSRGSARVAAAANAPGTSLPGRQHLGRRGLAAGRRHEQLAHRSGQVQRAGQQDAGVLVGGAGDAPFQVTDRTGAKARRLRQLLLRQPGLSAQLPQQPGETQLRLGHRPSVPSPPARRGHPRQAGTGLGKPYASPAGLAIPVTPGQRAAR